MLLTRFLIIPVFLGACASPSPQNDLSQSSEQICPKGEKIEFYDMYETTENVSPDHEQPTETIVMGLRCVVASTD